MNALKENITFISFAIFLMFLFMGTPDIFDSLQAFVINYLNGACK